MPEPKVPDAVITGFLNVTPAIVISVFNLFSTKGVANVAWEGNPTPRVQETYGGMLNAIGLLFIPVIVLISETASLPAASAALAISVISVTLVY